MPITNRIMPHSKPNPHQENLILTDATIRNIPERIIHAPKKAISVMSVNKRAERLKRMSSPITIVKRALSISQILLEFVLRPFHQLPKLPTPEAKTIAPTTQPRLANVTTGLAKQ